MRAPAGVFWALGLVVVAACDPAPRTIEIALAAPDAIGCRATELTTLRVQALGDFPTEVRPSVLIDIAGGPQAIERFPPETELVALRAEGFVRIAGGGTTTWQGGGLAPVDGPSRALRVPLLQLGRACALADTDARVPTGAVVIPLRDGRLLVAGGEGEAVLATVLTVRPGERLARTGALRLFTPRTGASGTELPSGDVLVIGGAVAATGPILDGIERLRVAEGEESRLDDGFLLRARRDHVAFLVADGVMVVGGRDEDGAVGDAEIVRVGDALASEAVGAAVPRWGATALTLDDGTVLIVGGEDDAAAVSVVERLVDRSLERTAAALRSRSDAAWVALPGGRALRVGGRDADGWSQDAELLLERGDVAEILPGVLVEVEEPVAVALADGRVLVGGRAPDGAPVAQVLDPGGTRIGGAVELSRVPDALVRLIDGTLVEADAAGLSLLRLDLANAFDDPQATLFPVQGDQRAELSLDAPGHWIAEADLLVAAVDGARLDLPTSRFRDVSVEIEVVGEGRLVFDVDGRAPYELVLGATELRFDRCVAPRSDPIFVERVGRRLRIGSTDCPFDEDARVGVGLSLAAGAGVRRISVARLSP